MKRWPRLLTGTIAAAAIAFSAMAGARAETVNLELKRLEPLGPITMAGGKLPADYLFRITSPQYFSMRAGSTDTSWILQGSSRPAVKPFSEVVSKEPDKYRSEQPFRGVARLGSDDYGFVLDLVPPEPDVKEPKAESEDAQSGAKEAQADSAEAVPESQESAADSEESKPKAYCALYFDRNHNGDLTDDEALEAEPPADQISGGSWWYQFPRIDVTLNVDGAQVDYGFLFGVSARVRGDVRYATAALMAGAYREGQITLGGKTRRIVLLDFNSNGRFDDEIQIRESDSGQISPTYGDMLLVDPDPKIQALPMISRNLIQHQVAKVTSIDGVVYDLDVSPGGDRLTLAPCAESGGHVKLPCDGLTATIYGEKGVLSIRGEKSKPIALPSGDWKLMSYTIDLTGYGESAEAKEGKSEESSLLEALTEALTESSGASASKPRPTQISAQGGKDCKVMKVRAGKTIALPFGPPYKPVVTAPPLREGRQDLQLGLSLVGLGGERCNSLVVDGSRPAEPEFTITTPKGEEVASGKFKWG